VTWVMVMVMVMDEDGGGDRDCGRRVEMPHNVHVQGMHSRDNDGNGVCVSIVVPFL